MPSKKKKYNARFPAGRIKKIMQSDEEVGKVAQAVPIIISRTLELFVESMLTKTLRITNARNAKTLTPSHMKQCIMSENRFDFLRELVKNIPDINVAEDMEDAQSSPLPQTEPNSNDSSSAPHSVLSTKRTHEMDPNAGSSSQWKFTKQHSLDSITNKAPNFYTQTITTDDNNQPINYSIAIRTDDKATASAVPSITTPLTTLINPTPKLARMESTPASFGSNNNSTTISANFVPVTTTKLSATPDKQPILTFDFTQIPLMPLAASTSQSTPNTSSTNHSHSVANILKTDNKSKSTNSHHLSAPKPELPSLPAKITRRSSSNKRNSQTTLMPTVTPNSSQSTSTMQSHSTSIATPLMSYSIPLSAGTNSLEMDEDYDNI